MHPAVKRVSRQLQRLIDADRVPIVAGPQDPARAATAAHLHHVSDEGPGIVRRKRGRAFQYVHSSGRVVKERATLARIRALAIPPAWTAVWISPDPAGHIQATGRDARGRKQYRYHPRWREVRDRTKFGRMIEFAQTLPRIRRAVAADLRRPGTPREKVLATVVRLLEVTCIRVGSDEYARHNHHFGLTTLRDRHVSVRGPELRFHFEGKSGKEHELDLRDPRLARIVRNCQEIPGQRLFQYVDERGKRHPVGSTDVNRYLRELGGADFTAKDFRTWAGTKLVASVLAGCHEPSSGKECQRQVLAAIDDAAARLGNTRSVCRSSYVHPAVIDAFTEGWLRKPPRVLGARSPHGLDPTEIATLRVLQAAARER